MIKVIIDIKISTGIYHAMANNILSVKFSLFGLPARIEGIVIIKYGIIKTDINDKCKK
jgi:hypothetical protein